MILDILEVGIIVFNWVRELFISSPSRFLAPLGHQCCQEEQMRSRFWSEKKISHSHNCNKTIFFLLQVLRWYPTINSGQEFYQTDCFILGTTSVIRQLFKFGLRNKIGIKDFVSENWKKNCIIGSNLRHLMESSITP